MINLLDLGQRLMDLDYWNNRDNDETPETIADKLADIDICHQTIEYLLDMIDDMEAMAN